MKNRGLDYTQRTSKNPGRCLLCGNDLIPRWKYPMECDLYCEICHAIFNHETNSMEKQTHKIENTATTIKKGQFGFKELPVDMVNQPPHYKKGGIETIDVIEAWKLDYLLGNAVKYISRHDAKWRPLEDLKKARWYLDRKIKNMEKSLPKETQSEQ